MDGVKIYVAGTLEDVTAVRAVQDAVQDAGHVLTLDWTRGPDSSVSDYATSPHAAATIARDDLQAVLDADAVLVVATQHDGRGMFVELGAAMAARSLGHGPRHVAVIGPIHHESVFYFHPSVTRVDDVDEWLAGLGRG